MKIEFLREFAKLAECGSYVRAANELFISQSALTRHIQALESELGHPLFIRSTRNLELTEVGEILLDGSRKIIAEYEATLSRIEDSVSGKLGSLSVGMLYYAVDKYMPPILKVCKEEYPKLRLSFSSYQPSGLTEDLLSGSIDVGLVCFKYTDYPQVVYLDFAREGAVLVVSDDSDLARRDTVSIEDLADVELVKMGGASGPHLRMEYEDDLEKLGLSPKPLRGFDNVDLMPMYLSEGGYGMVNPESMLAMHSNGMKMIPISGGICSTISFAYLADNDNPALGLFLSAVKKAYNI
ncbi:MAG: LysR family transcriptional regulator [Coriobacteriales bacterium]|jgi:DNA-binding transcriptional LysR family regulator